MQRKEKSMIQHVDGSLNDSLVKKTMIIRGYSASGPFKLRKILKGVKYLLTAWFMQQRNSGRDRVSLHAIDGEAEKYNYLSCLGTEAAIICSNIVTERNPL